MPDPPCSLRCEYLANPLGIDVRAPRLSWLLDDSRRSAKQTAYQVLVASSRERLAQDEGDLWDSGRVESGETVHVAYAGQPLASGQRCTWKVRTWDAEGVPSSWSEPACWSMGLLAEADWQAHWIGDPTPPPPPAPAHDGYRSRPAPAPDVVKWAIVDLKAPAAFDAVRLYGARVFGPPLGDVPGFLFPLRFRVDVSDRADFTTYATVVDRTDQDVLNPGVQPLTCRFDPIVGRYVRLVVTRLRPDGEGGYGVALAELEVLSSERNLARGAEVTALDSLESGAWSAARLVDGDVYWHTGGPVQPLPPPLLRRAFAIAGEVRHATAYASALGVYELRINGARVDDRMLAPEWTDYQHIVQYQAYDVTGLLRQGANAVGVLLGDGWYAGRIGMAQTYGPRRLRGVYGRQPRFTLQLVVELADGRRQTLVTDGTWRSMTDGPIRSSDLYDGEVYDARREVPGWDQPGFDDSDWNLALVDEGIQVARVAQMNEPIRATHELRAQHMTEPQPGVYVYDLRQNIAGRVRIAVQGRAGTHVTLRHAEALASDGTLYTAMLRGAAQTDRYTLRGDPCGETYEPHFTYHGFRYVEVIGLEQAPAVEDVVGCACHSSTEQAGYLETSSALVNQLWRNIVWTQRSNLMGVATDCPQRDERLGWLGDWQAFAHTAAYNMCLAAFLTKNARDMRLAQYADGRFPDMAPNVLDFAGGTSGRAAAGWGDGGILLPWVAYVHYGDRRLLEEHYAAARRWVDWVQGQCRDGIWESPFQFGDWLNGDALVLDDWPREGAAVPGDLFATAFFAYSARVLSKMAAGLDDTVGTRTYAVLAEAVTRAFNRAFVAPDGRMPGDTQAGYALALHFDLLPQEVRPLVARHLVRVIERYDTRVSTGMQATHRMLLALTRSGYNELAYQLLHERRPPSWGYMIEQGATTVWEHWDGYVAGRTLREADDRLPLSVRVQAPVAEGYQTTMMNSLNHFAFGSVGEWLYRVVLGIEPDEGRPGFKHFIVWPRPGGDLTYARGTLRTVRGAISVGWQRDGGAFALEVTVPPNTSATVYVPLEDEGTTIEESGQALVLWSAGSARLQPGILGIPAAVPGVAWKGIEGGYARFHVEAGTYRFRARMEGDV